MMRVGIGFDVHPFVSGRELVLGGVKIPYTMGLEGHSDADALTHAICDAILGALAEGDIGTHFPDTDPIYKGICSLNLLRDVIRLMQSEAYRVINIDATIVCEEPKLASYMASMKENIQHICGAGSVVNIKATRNERMGFIGRKEGLACIAVALLAEFDGIV